jgi:hypothetical protein
MINLESARAVEAMPPPTLNRVPLTISTEEDDDFFHDGREVTAQLGVVLRDLRNAIYDQLRVLAGQGSNRGLPAWVEPSPEM